MLQLHVPCLCIGRQNRAQDISPKDITPTAPLGQVGDTYLEIPCGGFCCRGFGFSHGKK